MSDLLKRLDDEARALDRRVLWSMNHSYEFINADRRELMVEAAARIRELEQMARELVEIADYQGD